MDTAIFATTSLKVGALQEELVCLLQQPDFPALLLEGAPGVGKTESVKWAARRCIHADGAPYDIVVLHPVGRDQSHVGGYPTIVNGEAVHVTYGDLRRLETASRPLVCLVDDFGQCAPSTQAAYQQLLQERSFNGVRVSPHVRFVLCTNRREDRAGVSGLLTTITGRTVQIDVEPDVERLVQFLAEEYPDVPELGSFLMKRPQFVTDSRYAEEAVRGALVASPSPRTIEYAARIRRLGRPPDRELALIAGACGQAFAHEFAGYCRVWRSLQPLSAILADPKGCRVPDAPHELYAECGSLAHAADCDNLPLLTTYVGRFLFEYQEYFRQLIEVQRPELRATATFAEFAAALGEAR